LFGVARVRHYDLKVTQLHRTYCVCHACVLAPHVESFHKRSPAGVSAATADLRGMFFQRTFS
jgi:hypothetical protein